MKIKFCLVARLGNPDIGAHKKSEQSKQGNPFDMQHTHTGRVWESIKAKLVQDWKQSLWQNWKCLLAIYPRLRLHDTILPNIANGIFLVYKCISLILTAYNYTLSAQCVSPSVLKKSTATIKVLQHLPNSINVQIQVQWHKTSTCKNYKCNIS